MKIIMFPKYSYEGPSSRYRFYNYKKCFKKNGLNVEIYPLFGKYYFVVKNKLLKAGISIFYYLRRLFYLFTVLLNYKKNKTLLIVQAEFFPYVPPIFEVIFNRLGIKYIVDYDDAIFHKYDQSRNFFIKKLLKNKIGQVIKNAEHVIVCNNYLKNYAIKYNKNITMLHTVVLLDKYIDEMKKFNNKNKDFIIGWIGSKSTSKYILQILPALEKFVKEFSNVKINLIGFDESLLDKKSIEELNINIIPWSEEKEIEEILKFDVGIMPLDDTPWSRGKCGFKLIQYMSCKKPVIASPVGINKEIVKNGENGYLADSINEWYESLKKIYLNKEMRLDMGEKGFKLVLDDFNYGKNCAIYSNLIKSL